MQITPDTKVADLLKAYPHLENVLIEYSPAFAALKNPVLKRTVAKVTSLQQAAKVGGVNVVEMVNVLRKQVGQLPLGENFTLEYNPADVPILEEAPNKAASHQLDVRPIIDAGGHPLDNVVILANELKMGDCLELISSFPPTPLIEVLQKKGFTASIYLSKSGTIHTFIERNNS